MIITKQKELKDILAAMGDEKKVFIVGCGECSTTCKTGGEKEVAAMKQALEEQVETLRASGVEFLSVPDSYYEMLPQRVQKAFALPDLGLHRLAVHRQRDSHVRHLFSARPTSTFSACSLK